MLSFVLVPLSLYDVEKRLLFVHVPKNAGESVSDGIQSWYANRTRSRSCAGFNYISMPLGLPGRDMSYFDMPCGLADDECPPLYWPQCDLTLQGMGCIGGYWGGNEHQSEEYMRAELQLCSHDGLEPILTPHANGSRPAVMSFALVRDPMDRLVSAWSHRLNDANFSLLAYGPDGGRLAVYQQLVDFKAWVKTRGFIEGGSRPWKGPPDTDFQSEESFFCSSKSGIFEHMGGQYVRMFGGPDEDDYHYYYQGNAWTHAFTLPLSAMVTECTVLLPVIGDISAPSSAIMQFLESFYPGFIMGHDTHREAGQVKHVPVIDDETRRIVREVYTEDYRIWVLVQDGSAYYPPDWQTCTPALPDGSRAAPSTSWDAKGANWDGFERSLQPDQQAVLQGSQDILKDPYLLQCAIDLRTKAHELWCAGV